MDTTLDSVKYAAISDSQRGEALAMLVSREPPTGRAGAIAAVAAALRQGGDSAATLVGATRDGKLKAVAWAQILPGKTALLWAPRLAPDELAAVGDRLQTFLDSQLQAAGIRMAQAVLPNREHPDARWLERGGYTHAADLLYLASDLARCEVAIPEFDVDFVRYARADRKRLSDLIERTYVNTLDVPALDGTRDLDDVLNGYEQTGDFSPDRWFFIRDDDQDVGCLLLNDHRDSGQWELVYMGIVPDARGHGWGRQATEFAQQAAKRAGRDRMILAVDAANDPAVNAYTKAGFFELFRRAVFLKIFSK